MSVVALHGTVEHDIGCPATLYVTHSYNPRMQGGECTCGALDRAREKRVLYHNPGTAGSPPYIGVHLWGTQACCAEKQSGKAP